MLLLLTFSLSALIPIIIKLVVAALIAYVVLWAISRIGLPEPFNKILTAIVIVAIAIYCISLLDKFL